MASIRQRRGRWQAQVRVNGVAESATFDTEKQATIWAKAREKSALLAPKKPTETLSGLMLAYQRYRESVRPLSRGMQHSIKAALLAPFADKHLHDITAKELLEWGMGMEVAPATVAHHLMVMRSAWQSSLSLVGVEVEMKPLLHAMQALKRVKAMAKAKSRDRRISDAEIEAICLHLMGKWVMIPTHTYVRLAVALPRRREEICEMLWSDYSGDTIILRDTKNPREPRDEVVPVPPEAKAIIDALPRIDERIFPYKPESVSAAFQRAVREVGLEDIRLHDLRHEGISRLFEKGLQIQEVALVSGHLSWSSLRRYTHIKPESVALKLRAPAPHHGTPAPPPSRGSASPKTPVTK